MKFAAFFIALAALCGSIHAHPFDDRADMITHISIREDRQIELYIYYYFSTIASSYIEARFKLDADKDGKVTPEERDKRLAELVQDRLDNMDLQVNDRRVKLVADPARYQCLDMQNPDNDFASGGMSVNNVRLGYAMGFTARIESGPVDGRFDVKFIFLSKAERIDDPESQIRAFDERAKPPKAIADMRYEQTPNAPFVVSFGYKASRALSGIGEAARAAGSVGARYVPRNGTTGRAPPDFKGAQVPETDERKKENQFTELFDNLREGKGSLWYWVLALLVVFLWGCEHAIQPGHGKTLVASYLIGTQGRKSDALFLGIVVTLAHTSGVILMLGGLVALQHFWPGMFDDPMRSMQQWISLAVGITILIMGVGLLLKRAGGEAPHEHDMFGRHIHEEHDHSHGHDHAHEHGHEHGHSHGGHWHSHSHDSHDHSHAGVALLEAPAKVAVRADASPTTAPQEKFMSRWEILRLGVLGGIVPCPAAMVIGLIAVGKHQPLAGLLLVVVFSLGLAVVLSTIGLVMVASKSYLNSRSGTPKSRIYRFMATKLPVIGALGITLIGFTMVLMALLRLGVLDMSTFTV